MRLWLKSGNGCTIYVDCTWANGWSLRYYQRAIAEAYPQSSETFFGKVPK